MNNHIACYSINFCDLRSNNLIQIYAPMWESYSIPVPNQKDKPCIVLRATQGLILYAHKGYFQGMSF